MTPTPSNRSSRTPTWLGLAAALLLLNAAITFVNIWPTPMIRWSGRGSFELALCVLGLLALRHWRGELSRRITTWLAVAWVLLALGRYVSVTAPALWGREINFYWDMRFVPDVASMLLRATPLWLILVVAVTAAALLWGGFALIRRAFGDVVLAIGTRAGRTALLVLAVATIGVFVAQTLFRSTPLDPYDVVLEPYMAEPVTQSFARQVKLAVKSVNGARSLPAGPSFGNDFDLVRGADVLLVFIESYGAATFDRPEMAARLSGPRSAFEGAIRSSGREVVSAFVESPTFGGSSWFAHLTLLSGVEVRDPDTNAMLMANQRETLVSAFSRNGYRTVALMPGLWHQWPEGAFYRFDEVIGAEKLAYHGPPYGWWTIPDQFSLAWVDAHELLERSRSPVFLFYPTVNTHIPFTPTPPYQPDWARMLKPHPFDTPDLLRSYEETLDWLNLGPSYLTAVSYTYKVLGGYLTERADRDFVMIVLGDHQPPAVVSGEGTSWDVPVHIVTNRKAVVDRLLSRGFHRGMNPMRQRIATMQGLLPTLLESFSSHTKPPAAIPAQ